MLVSCRVVLSCEGRCSVVRHQAHFGRVLPRARLTLEHFAVEFAVRASASRLHLRFLITDLHVSGLREDFLGAVEGGSRVAVARLLVRISLIWLLESLVLLRRVAREKKLSLNAYIAASARLIGRSVSLSVRALRLISRLTPKGV